MHDAQPPDNIGGVRGMTAPVIGTDHQLIPDIVHIGYPKAGSTFLQRNVFPYLANPVAFITKAEAMFTGKHFEICRGEAAGRVALARRSNGLILVSQEHIAAEDLRDRPENAVQLHRINPMTKIVIVVRSQFTIMRGAYMLAVKGTYARSFADYIEETQETKYRYDKVLELYRDLFGAENVKVILHEELLSDPDATIRGLLTFMGVAGAVPKHLLSGRVRVTPSDLMIDAQRMANVAANATAFNRTGRRRLKNAITFSAAVLEKKIWKPLTGKAINYRAYDAYRTRLVDAYGDSNRQFFERLGRPIGEYDYPF